jgi:pimeloyl-ACP methyl ester carboxylesterase
VTSFRLIPVDEVHLEVCDQGAGEPVLLVQTALTADELRPLAEQLTSRDAFRTILFHRRGYAGSSPVQGPGSIRRDAADCCALLATLGVESAHVVGVSYSASVALQLAVDARECVRTLALLEPPPVHVPSQGRFWAANQQLQDTRRTRGPEAALEEFLALVIGPTWRLDVEKAVPGSAEQMQRDTVTFFDTDLPALRAWRFSADDARTISCPVLYIGGTNSGPWFAEVRQLILGWIPHAEDVVLAGADHSLALTHPAAIAAALADFIQRHPSDGRAGDSRAGWYGN